MYNPTQRLMRSRNDKMLAGVAGGIAQYLGVDATIVRLGFLALCFTGASFVLYPLLWLIMPLEGSQQPAPQQAMTEMRQQAARMGDEIREVFVAGGQARRPRYDPMTGAPIDPEPEIPINNVNPPSQPNETQQRRNQMLGIVLLSLGAFILLTALPGIGPIVARLILPAALIGGGIYILTRR